MAQRRFGVLQFQVDGEVYAARGSFEYNLGGEARETQAGADSIHGYTVERRPAHIAGNLSDSGGLDVKRLSHIRDATITLQLENGKMIVLTDAVQVDDSTANAQDGTIPVRFETDGDNAQEVT